jgi:hypothetical protein
MTEYYLEDDFETYEFYVQEGLIDWEVPLTI